MTRANKQEITAPATAPVFELFVENRRTGKIVQVPPSNHEAQMQKEKPLPPNYKTIFTNPTALTKGPNR